MKLQDVLARNGDFQGFCFGIGMLGITPGASGDVTFPQANSDQVPVEVWVFAAGAVKLTFADGRTATLTYTTSMTYPQVIPYAVTKVWQTGTTVADGNLFVGF